MKLAKPPDLDVVQVHLDRNDAPLFEESHPYRIATAREMVRTALEHLEAPATIWELGCGSADISGPFSDGHMVYGVDVVPVAQTVCRSRWPSLKFYLARVEDIAPQDSDVLILTEVLEHLTDPLDLVAKWLPRAKWSVIGHPLVGDGTDDEPGHRWTYNDADFRNWFAMGGHALQESTQFGLGPYPAMVLGLGRRD